MFYFVCEVISRYLTSKILILIHEKKVELERFISMKTPIHNNDNIPQYNKIKHTSPWLDVQFLKLVCTSTK